MDKHSPEPWHVGGVGGCRPKLVYDASGRTIIRSWGNGSDEESEANVQLAAQAPKLREQVRILREALTTLRSMHLAGLTADDPTIAIHQGICDRAIEASRAEVADLRRQLEERRVVVDPVDVANRAQLVTGRSIWPETVKAIISVLPDAVRPLSPGEVVVGREFLGMLESAANRFCSSCRDNNPSCTMTARHFGGTGCGAWKLDGARINALRSGEAERGAT